MTGASHPWQGSVLDYARANFFSEPEGDSAHALPGLGLGLGVGLGLGLAALAGIAVAGPRELDRVEPRVFVHGAPQPKQISAGAPLRWLSDELTIVFDASLEQIGPGGREAAKAAFGAWIGSGAALPRLFYEDRTGLAPSLEPDGVSSVVYAPIELADQKQALAISISHVSPATGAIVEVDVIVNSQSPFALLGSPGPACGDRYDLQNVLTHEAGHFFGLDEDEGDPAATMFYKTGVCELQKRDLSGSDEAALRELYATEPELGAVDAEAGCGVPVARAGAGPSGAPIIAALVLLLGRARRARRRGMR